MFSGGNLSQSHDLRPGHHALHLGLDHLPAPRQRLSAAGEAAEGGRERAARRSTNTPATPRWSSACSRRCLYVQYIMKPAADGRARARPWQGYQTVTWYLAHHGPDHDRRHHLPDVARRADRRVRHRQRHQPDHHGRHPGPHARRHAASLFFERRPASRSRSSRSAAAARPGHRASRS